ncbi:aminopeptidase P family N-terminal domain-containing protein, partial [Yersinia pestis]
LNTVSRKLRTIMERDNIDAVIVTTCDNFYHVTGILSFFMYTFRIRARLSPLSSVM